MANDRSGILPHTDSSHAVVVALVLLHERCRLGACANPDARAAIVVATVAPHDWLGVFTDANAGANVAMADVVDHEGP